MKGRELSGSGFAKRVAVHDRDLRAERCPRLGEFRVEREGPQCRVLRLRHPRQRGRVAKGECIERVGEGKDATISIIVDGIPVVTGVAFSSLGTSSQSLRLGVFVEGVEGGGDVWVRFVDYVGLDPTAVWSATSALPRYIRIVE